MLPTSLMKDFVGKRCKKWPLSKSYFLQKPCFLKFFSILEENCGTDIINGTFKCKTFVGKYFKKRPLSKLYLPTKAKSFQSFLNSSTILKEISLFVKSTILGKSIFEGLDGVEM